ncbi:hypothetical protein COLO4_17974 [Corchorus olitorius]|uniref:Gnk2-homologous domain-containing protein n=1 Tax=Corchorus olitorius TaxID=93759 RepID=A0A1R3JAX5_9ROSI|nr:hypothetical protein COLO4_17974 [Corchorus olitorius]
MSLQTVVSLLPPLAKTPTKFTLSGFAEGTLLLINVIGASIPPCISSCPNQKEAISWGVGAPCIARYADRLIFGVLELEPTDAGYNTGDVPSAVNLTQFDLVWESLMDSVVKKASMGSSTLKYATGEADAATFLKIYALMQCTPDLSQENCDLCLRQSAIYYQGCCHGKQGGYVQKPNCLFRWDLYPFYVANASTSATAPSLSPPLSPASPSPPSSTNTTITKEDGGISSQTITVIVVPIVIFIVAVAIIAVALLLKRRKKTRQQDVNNNDSSKEYSLQFVFDVVRVATDNFSDVNKLGQGGFGSVYKGKLHNGQDIAVKRLSQNSGQGEQEFKNEVQLIAKLEHRNLAWKNWNAGTALEIIDPILRDGSRSEMMRCIQLGLLCIQENIAYRPTMGSVVLRLSSFSISLPVPSRPAYLNMHSTSESGTESGSYIYESDQSKCKTSEVSVNEASFSEFYPR